MPAPTKDELDRYMDLLTQGFEHDDAVLVIWPEPEAEPAPAKPTKQKRPTFMVTEFPDGIVIGWDYCAALNGGCGKLVAECACKDGHPKELKVFQEWRTGAKQMPDYASAARAVRNRGNEAGKRLENALQTKGTGEGIEGVVVATQPEITQVPCREGKHLVPINEADQNDDKTWTCHACQEGASRVQVDG